MFQITSLHNVRIVRIAARVQIGAMTGTTLDAQHPFP